MNSFIDWLEGYLESKLDDKYYMKRIREKYEEIENKKFIDNIKIPTELDWMDLSGSKTPRTYGDICPCNPKNGGSGICGCVIGNQEINVAHPAINTTTTDGTEYNKINYVSKPRNTF